MLISGRTVRERKKRKKKENNSGGGGGGGGGGELSQAVGRTVEFYGCIK